MIAEHDNSGVVKHNPESSPLVFVQGNLLTNLPKDLYIPPEPLRVFLETFEGPLDLLLYFIKKQNIDILDIPIAKITRQYIQYIELMEEFQLELAGEYLLMAGILAEIKSRLLLPSPPQSDDEEEVDPRVELMEHLQEYKLYKEMAEKLAKYSRCERDVFPIQVSFPARADLQKPLPKVKLDSLVTAFGQALHRLTLKTSYRIYKETLSVKDRVLQILDRVNKDTFTEFQSFFSREEGKAGVIVTFLAILELTRDSMLETIQNKSNDPIYVRAKR